jgi:thiopeptide-type bacteriocin biosynthesis protein
MKGQVDTSWLYYRVFLGRATDRTDHFIITTIARARSYQGIQSWFFLRYYEDGEHHLRLRLKPAASAYKELGEYVQAVCTGGLSGVSELSPSDYRPMVYPPGLDPTAQNHTGDVRIEMFPYEPEYEKYGGPQGVALAESHFMASSEVAIDILNDEMKGVYSRKTLAPLLMRLAYLMFAPQESAEVFWSQYAKYWLGGDTPIAHDWRLRFFEKARELDAAGIPIFTPDSELPEAGAKQLHRWREGLGASLRQYESGGILDRVARSSLCSNFIHLMNNRLGISLLEEAYLATLCEHAERRPSSLSPRASDFSALGH